MIRRSDSIPGRLWRALAAVLSLCLLVSSVSVAFAGDGNGGGSGQSATTLQYEQSIINVVGGSSSIDTVGHSDNAGVFARADGPNTVNYGVTSIQSSAYEGARVEADAYSDGNDTKAYLEIDKDVHEQTIATDLYIEQAYGVISSASAASGKADATADIGGSITASDIQRGDVPETAAAAKAVSDGGQALAVVSVGKSTTAESKDKDAVGADTSATSASSGFASAQVHIRENVEAGSTGSNAYGIKAAAKAEGSGTAEAIVEVCGDVTAESESKNAVGVQAGANAPASGKAEATVIVDGNVTATASGEGSREETDPDNYWITAGSATGVDGGTVYIGGDIRATKENSYSDEAKEALAADIAFTVTGARAIGIAGGDVMVDGSVFAVSDWEAQGIATNSANGNDIHVGQDVTAEGYLATGIQVHEGGSAVQVDGDVKADGGLTGVGVTASLYNSYAASPTVIQIGGDIGAKMTNSAGRACGVEIAQLESTGSIIAQIGGSVTAEGNSGSTGVYGWNSGNSGITIKVGSETGGGVSASGFEVCGVISEDNTSISVAGDVTATASVSGKDPAESSSATGVKVLGNGTANVNGDVTATADEAIGIQAAADTGRQASVTVGGDVRADGIRSAAGIALKPNDGAIGVTVGGNVESGTDGIVISTDFVDGMDGSVGVDIFGDVKAKEAGIVFGSGVVDGTVDSDILIAGTLSGREGGICILGDDSNAMNMSLTVWKIDVKQDASGEDFVACEKQSAAAAGEITDQSKKIEENIEYIIRFDRNLRYGTASLSGTTVSHQDYDVAKEGQKVILNIVPQKGYKVTAAYNGVETKLPLAVDAKGNYYILVPKGGGVYLSAVLEKVRAASGGTVKAMCSVSTEDGVSISFFRNGSYVIRLKDGSSEHGIYKLAGDRIVLVSDAGAEMTISENSELIYMFANDPAQIYTIRFAPDTLAVISAAIG